MAPASDLAAALDLIADLLAERIAARLLAGTRPGQVDQKRSSLGPRRHCAAVRRRINSGESGAAIVGDRYLLSDEAHAQELVNAGKPKKMNGSVTEELLSELRLVGARR